MRPIEFGVMRSGFVPVPREVLLDAGAIEPTAEEREQAERDAAQSRKRQAEREQRLEAARRALAEISDPLTRAILDLHAEDERHECAGDDFDGYESERPDWPCRTVEVVAAHHGIGLPS
ncbi:hypothetical protein [Actinomadura sp. SCN-SB]|uniref:hypothetical protein n=1 Tax=Actinomadura sp. SCN-SB TaxID=3373092 RepID=UPI0037533572